MIVTTASQVELSGTECPALFIREEGRRVENPRGIETFRLLTEALRPAPTGRVLHGNESFTFARNVRFPLTFVRTRKLSSLRDRHGR